MTTKHIGAAVYGLSLLTYSLLTLLGYVSWISTWIVSLITLCTLVGLYLLWTRTTGRRASWNRWIGSFLAIVVLCLSVPLPSLHAIAINKPTAYAKEGFEGKLLAPEVTVRQAFVMDWIHGEAATSDELAQRTTPVIDTEFSVEEDQALAEFQGLPYDIPDGFYAKYEDALTHSHTLIRLLHDWNQTTDFDVMQGKKVMGFGAVAEDGRIYMTGDVASLTAAAVQADPDVFIVPVDAFNEAREIAPTGLLVVPVSHFEEVLYFLEQPVALWPISSFGLFCH